MVRRWITVQRWNHHSRHWLNSLATAWETQGQRSPTEMRDLNTSNIRNCHSRLVYIYSNGWLVSAWYAIHESQERMRNKRYWEKKGKVPFEADHWTHSLKRLSKFPPTNHATISLFLKTVAYIYTHTMDWASFLSVKLIWEWIKSALFLMASRGATPDYKSQTKWSQENDTAPNFMTSANNFLVSLKYIRQRRIWWCTLRFWVCECFF